MSEWKGIVHYHTAAPVWNETVRIELKKKWAGKAHVLLQFNQVSSSGSTSFLFACCSGLSLFEADKEDTPLGFTFLRLGSSGTIIQNQDYTLPVYKCLSKLPNDDKVWYLNPSSTDLVVKKAEAVVVRTKLVSNCVSHHGK
jgi:hypothetical protein